MTLNWHGWKTKYEGNVCTQLTLDISRQITVWTWVSFFFQTAYSCKVFSLLNCSIKHYVTQPLGLGTLKYIQQKQKMKITEKDIAFYVIKSVKSDGGNRMNEDLGRKGTIYCFTCPFL